MIRRAVHFALAATVLAAPSAASVKRQSASTQSNLCRLGERAVYSCEFGKKIGSLCLGRHTMHYRYGSMARTEVDLSSTTDWSNVFYGSLYSGSMVEEHVRMTTGNISYVVFAGEGGRLSEIPGKAISGIAVMRGLETPTELKTLECRQPTRFAMAAGKIFEAAPDGWSSDELESFDLYY